MRRQSIYACCVALMFFCVAMLARLSNVTEIKDASEPLLATVGMDGVTDGLNAPLYTDPSPALLAMEWPLYTRVPARWSAAASGHPKRVRLKINRGSSLAHTYRRLAPRSLRGSWFMSLFERRTHFLENEGLDSG